MNETAERLKEIQDSLEVGNNALRSGHSKNDLANMAKRLLPLYGGDLFRVLVMLPMAKAGFPSVEKIENAVKERMRDSNKKFASTAEALECSKQVFGRRHYENAPRTPALEQAMNDCLNSLRGKAQNQVILDGKVVGTYEPVEEEGKESIDADFTLD